MIFSLRLGTALTLVFMTGRKTIPLFDLLSRSDPATSGLPRVGADRNGPRAQHGVGGQTPKSPPARGTVQTKESANVKPTVRVELKPLGQPAPQAAEAASTTTEATEQPRAVASQPIAQPIAKPHLKPSLLAAASSGRTITLPALVPFLTVVLALGAIITTWIIAYGRGSSNKERELQPILQATRPTVTEPGIGPGTGLTTGLNGPDNSRAGSSAGSKASAGTSPNAAQAQKTAQKPNANPSNTNTSASIAPLAALQASPPTQAAILTSSGWKTVEIREVSMNYLNIATLKHVDAASAIHYLAQNGLEAFGVPLASGSQRGNTSPPATYRIFVLPGISSEQYRARQSVMTNLEASVARLGRQWSRDQKGASDFRSPQWTKFDDK